MDFPVESYSFLPGSRAILDLSYRSRLRNSNYTMSQQSRPTISMITPITKRGNPRGNLLGVRRTQRTSTTGCCRWSRHLKDIEFLIINLHHRDSQVFEDEMILEAVFR